MKWNNLKNRKCPKCNSFLDENSIGMKCRTPNCNFLIGKGKAAEILKKMDEPPRQPFREEIDRASEWNNFGHQEVNRESFL